jgi:hypothetical protein
MGCLPLSHFSDPVNLDPITFWYRTGLFYLEGSHDGEELCDEIQRLRIAIHSYQNLSLESVNFQDRSTTIIEALKMYRDYFQGCLEDLQLDAGEL